jgi:hypothetical protein
MGPSYALALTSCQDEVDFGVLHKCCGECQAGALNPLNEALGGARLFCCLTHNAGGLNAALGGTYMRAHYNGIPASSNNKSKSKATQKQALHKQKLHCCKSLTHTWQMKWNHSTMCRLLIAAFMAADFPAGQLNTLTNRSILIVP